MLGSTWRTSAQLGDTARNKEDGRDRETRHPAQVTGSARDVYCTFIAPLPEWQIFVEVGKSRECVCTVCAKIERKVPAKSVVPARGAALARQLNFCNVIMCVISIVQYRPE